MRGMGMNIEEKCAEFLKLCVFEQAQQRGNGKHEITHTQCEKMCIYYGVFLIII